MRILLSIASLLLVACAGDEAERLAPPAIPPAIRAAPVEPALVGVVAARSSEVVAAQIDGRILRVLARSGQRVHAGDVIAELDPALVTERLLAAIAAVDAARAEAAGAVAEGAEAQRQLALEQRMFRAGAAAEESVRISHASVSRVSAASARAAAVLRQAEANRAAIQSQLAYTHVVASIDGVVSLVKAQPGQVVVPGAAIARVFDPAQLVVRFQVTHARRRDVVNGTIVELHIPGVATALEARVTSVSMDLEPPLDFAVAEADLLGGSTELQIGTLGDVRIAH